MSQTLDVKTSVDVLDAVHAVAATALSSSQEFVPAIHNERARLAEHDASPSAHGVDDPQSALCAAFAVAAASGIGTAPSVKKLADEIGQHASTLADIALIQNTFGTNAAAFFDLLASRETELTRIETAVTSFSAGVTELREEAENGSYGGGGSPVSLPTLSGPEQIGIGLSAEYTLFCIGSAIDGATIASFEVTFAGGTAQTVPAVGGGMATATVTAPAETAEGSVLTLSVVAVDSSGFRSNEAMKDVTAIQSVVQAPSLSTPAPGAYVSPGSVTFTTSSFSTIGASDTHAASRFKLTTDAAGNNVVYDSGRNTTDKLTHTATLTTTLTPGTTYYAWAQHEGASLGIGSWSNPVAIVAASVVTPQITSPSESAEISPNNITVTTTAFAVIGGVADTHASTDWKITSDAEGATTIAEALASADLTSHVFASPAVTRGQTYYLWARHNGATTGTGAWAKVQVSIKTIRHGEILYDTSGQPAAVITGSYASRGAEPWTIRGKKVWIAVALASKRGVNKPWCTGTSSSSTGYGVDISTIENPGNNWRLALNNTGADKNGSYVSAQSTEAHMDASFTYSQTVKNSEGLTDAILAYNSSMQAAAYCRGITLADLGKMDLPSIDVLMRIYQARTIIDDLDTTAAANTAKKLGNWGFGSVGSAGVWSASESNNYSVWSVASTGVLNDYGKNTQFGVVPALEIPA